MRAMYRQNIQFSPKDAALRDDVRALGESIGDMLREQGGDAFVELVEGDRCAAIARREREGAAGGDGTAGGDGAVHGNGALDHAGAPTVDLAARTAGRAPAAATDLTRAFSVWFQAVNTAEKVHRVRRRREYLDAPNSAQPGGIADCVARLHREGLTLAEVMHLIASMSIEPVFTPHPTESTRRTILRKQQHIAQDLLDRLNPGLTSGELETLWARVRLELTTIWQTEEHPRENLTVADEREHVLFYLIDILYRIVPLFYEEIEAALASAYSVPRESLDLPNILRFGSWVGGDMEGNAEVHGKAIRETLQRHRQTIVSTYYEEARHLAENLSQSANRCAVTPALAQRIDAYTAMLPASQALTPARHDRMPYRVFFGQIGERLKATYESRPNGYFGSEELLADIELVATSLILNRGRHAGYFLVRRFLRRVRTFGFHLAALDITQHAHVHDEVIAQGLGDPGWVALPREQRLLRLRDLLDRDQGPTSTFDAMGRRTLSVFEAIGQARHKFGARSIGEYIVSGTNGPEDLLAVLLLARWAEVIDRRTGECALDVAPSLESINAIENAGAILEGLLAEPAYRSHLGARNDRQIVLIGYSECNKQAGIAASRWAMQNAQVQLLKAAGAAGVRITLFHARGGTAARGGGRTERLVESVPAGAMRGVLRLTEQGDVVNQSYGLRPIAMRTLERAFAAVALAAAKCDRQPAVPDAQREAMQRIASGSSAAYRNLVFTDSGFFDYFQRATPLDVIERMHIGARPATREGGQGVGALRPIPWVFAWSQSRHMLPGWYGFGTGLAAAFDRDGAVVLASMLKDWPFFRHLVDDVEETLARTDLNLAALYDTLAGDGFTAAIAAIRAEHALTVGHVLRLRGYEQLLDRDPTLQRSIRLRNPYIDPMHFMQIDLLRRWRATQREDRELFAALRATISGIALGLQATG
jgi:phosphoenolpyruvate carboxylase